MDLVSDPRTIVFMRVSGMGDLMFAVPALRAIRTRFPSARLVYLGSALQAALLEGRGLVDEVVEVPRYPGVGAPGDARFDRQEVRRFVRRVREMRPDVVVQAHGGGRYSTPLAYALGAPLTIGLRAPSSPPLDREVAYRVYHSEYDRYMEVAALLGAHEDPRSRSAGIFPVLAQDLAESVQALPGDGRCLVVMNTGATDGRRRWAEERFVRLGRHLAGLGYLVALTGDAQDAERTDRIARSAGDHVVDVAGRLSLRGLAGTLARASLVVSNDSGPLHLATGIGRPTVGLYWCGNLVTATPRTRSDHRPLISWRTACPACGTICVAEDCGHHDSFVDDIRYEHVLLECLDLLGHERSSWARSGDEAGEGRCA